MTRVIYVVSQLHGGLLSDVFAFTKPMAAQAHLESLVITAAPTVAEDTGVEIPPGSDETTYTYRARGGQRCRVTIVECAADTEDEIYLEAVPLVTNPGDLSAGSTRMRRVAW